MKALFLILILLILVICICGNYIPEKDWYNDWNNNEDD